MAFQWTKWSETHHGPLITYLANCNGDCSTVDKTTLEFFKIDEGGLVDDSSVPGTWASDIMINNNNTWTSTIPIDIGPGNYVVRHEIIALHGAGSEDGAQNYPQCLNLEITGSGTLAPSGTLGEKLYTSKDAGILVNIYAPITSYTIPGPPMYNASGSGSGSGAGSSSAAASPAPTSAVASSAVATSVPAASSVAISSVQSAVVSTTAAPTTMVTSVASPAATSAPAGGDDDECEA